MLTVTCVEPEEELSFLQEENAKNKQATENKMKFFMINKGYSIYKVTPV